MQEVVVTAAQFREQNVRRTRRSRSPPCRLRCSKRATRPISPTSPIRRRTCSLKQQGPTFGPSIAASIRGIGQVDFNPALGAAASAFTSDDVYYATLTGSMLDLLDLDRVEILRGPQGTLAGRNSIGGAVKLYSQKPKGDGSGYLAATYGIRDRVDLRGSADFALADNLFARISGGQQAAARICRSRVTTAAISRTAAIPARCVPNIGGCVIDCDSDVNLEAVRGALALGRQTEDLELNLALDYTHDDRNPTGTVLIDRSTQVRDQRAGVCPSGPAGGQQLSLAPVRRSGWLVLQLRELLQPGDRHAANRARR